MSTTIVYGKSSDGYLYSYDPNFTNSRNGPADGASGGPTLFVGRNNNQGSFAHFLAYVGYDYPAVPASDVVTAANVRAYIANLLSPTFAQDLVWRAYTWSTLGGFVVADWRTPTQIAALRNDGSVRLLSHALDKLVQASSDELLNAVRLASSIEHVIHTNNNLSGTAPARDEAVAISAAETAGTYADPQLVYTSTPRSTLFGVLGAQVELSDGWAWLESNGAAAPTITLRFRSFDSATVTTVATVPVGTAANSFAVPGGYQALALVANAAGDLFVLGGYSQAKNSLAVLAFQRGAGVTWTAKTMRFAPMPAYTTSINQVAATWHPYGAGSITAFVGHVGGVGDSETQYAIIDVAPLLANSATSPFVRGAANALPALGVISPPAGHFNAWHNEVGSGMDVATLAQAGGSPDHGLFYSFGGNQALGGNAALHEGWYALNATSTGFGFTKLQSTGGYGRKDAGGKVRVVPVSSQAVAFVSADSDLGWGLTVRVVQHSGSSAVEIGSFHLRAEDIPSAPDGPVVGSSPAWDAVYNGIDNTLHVYYVDAGDAGTVRRTVIDLTTMGARLTETLVYDAPGASTVQAIRLQRNKGVGQRTLVTLAVETAGALSTVYVVDTFNIAPTAPTIAPRANFDAAQSAVFAWTHNDPNADPQSAYQLEIWRVSDGVTVLDTGKTASATQSRTLAGGTLANGIEHAWRVRTWDTSDVVSPYSANGVFVTSAGGTVTITAPASDFPQNVITDDIPVSWSVSGTTQAAYRVWLYRGAVLVSDSGWIASAATQATATGMLSDQAHEIRVQVRNAASVATNVAVRRVTPSFSTPERPTVSVTPLPDEGYMLISVDNPTPGAPDLGFPEEGFESGIGTWAAGAGGAVSATTDAHRGAGALLLAATAGGVDPVAARDPGALRPVLPGERYTARMWVKANATASVGAVIDWLATGGGLLSSSSFATTVAAGEWTLVQVTGTAPAGAALATCGPALLGGVPAGRTLAVDEVTLGTASDRPDVTGNRILRRVAGSAAPFEVVCEVGPDGTCHDYTATAGVAYEYVVRGVA